MPYFPVDDDMAFHPKILAAGNEAIGLWARAGALAKKHATGGYVSTETARALGPKKLADRLVSAGLFIEVEGGYRFHDWSQQAGNDEADVERERRRRARERNTERQRKFRERNADRNGVTDATVTTTPSPSPSPMTDYTRSESQSRDTRARVSTDAEADGSEVTKRLAAQKGIASLNDVAEQIRRHTGLRVDVHAAYQVAVSLLDRAKVWPDAPSRYVAASIEKSPLEVQKYIHDHALEVAT